MTQSEPLPLPFVKISPSLNISAIPSRSTKVRTAENGRGPLWKSGQTDPFSPYRFSKCVKRITHLTISMASLAFSAGKVPVRQKMHCCESQDLLCLMAIPITFCPELLLITICTGPTRSGPVHTSAGNIVQIGHCPLFLPSCHVFSLPMYGPIVIPAADPSQRECVAAFPVAAHLNSLSLHDPDHRLSG